MTWDLQKQRLSIQVCRWQNNPCVLALKLWPLKPSFRGLCGLVLAFGGWLDHKVTIWSSMNYPFKGLSGPSLLKSRVSLEEGCHCGTQRVVVSSFFTVSWITQAEHVSSTRCFPTMYSSPEMGLKASRPRERGRNLWDHEPKWTGPLQAHSWHIITIARFLIKALLTMLPITI